jgi:primosomal protein N''
MYDLIGPYLNQFSPTVQTVLKVKEKDAERQYLIERLAQQVSFFLSL